MGITLRDDKDYELSTSQFKEALLIAPWWGEAYKELGLTLKFGEKYSDAIQALQNYIKTQPGEKEASSAEDEISIMKAKKMKADKVQEEPVVTSEKNLKAESLKGNWYGSGDYCPNDGHYRFDVIGDLILVYMVYDREAEYGLPGGGSKIVQPGFEDPEPTYQLKWLGKGQFEGTKNTTKWNFKYVGIESEDGKSMRFVVLSKSIDLEHNLTRECLLFRK